MTKKYMSICVAIILTTCFFSGCAAPIIGAAGDERSFRTHVNDSVIEAKVKKALLEEKFSKIRDINIYSFQGHVYLVGEADSEFGAKAKNIASQVNNVNEVTTHFFPVGTSTANDAVVEAKIDGQLLFTKNIPSSKVQVDVWGGEAVLLGIIDSQTNINRIVTIVKGMPDVKSVTNYLTLIK